MSLMSSARKKRKMSLWPLGDWGAEDPEWESQSKGVKCQGLLLKQHEQGLWLDTGSPKSGAAPGLSPCTVSYKVCPASWSTAKLKKVMEALGGWKSQERGDDHESV